MSNGLHALPDEARRELWKHETATEVLSVVEHDSNSQLMVTDDYGDMWWLDVEDVRSLRDALTEWLDRAVDVHEGQMPRGLSDYPGRLGGGAR